MLLSKQAKWLTDWWRRTLTEWCRPAIDWLKLPEHRDEWYSKHSPNLVTLARGVISALLLFGLFRNMHNYPVRSALITLLGFVFWLDGVDGMLATELDRKTLLGRIMDPVFDVLTLIASGVFVYQLGWVNPTQLQNTIATWSVALIIAFHILIWLLGMPRKTQGERLGIDIDSLPLGKVKLVYGLVFSLMVGYLPTTTLMPAWLCYVTLVPTGLLCFLAQEEYRRDLVTMMRTR